MYYCRDGETFSFKKTDCIVKKANSCSLTETLVLVANANYVTCCVSDFVIFVVSTIGSY